MTRVHFSFATPQLPETSAFYESLFGEAPDKVQDDYVRFAPTNHPIVLSLLPGEPSGVTGHEHFGLRFEDLEQTLLAIAQAKQAGLAVETEGEVTCCWSKQHKAWVSDPDGRWWEIYTVTDDTPVQAVEKTACCA